MNRRATATARPPSTATACATATRTPRTSSWTAPARGWCTAIVPTTNERLNSVTGLSAPLRALCGLTRKNRQPCHPAGGTRRRVTAVHRTQSDANTRAGPIIPADLLAYTISHLAGNKRERLICELAARAVGRGWPPAAERVRGDGWHGLRRRVSSSEEFEVREEPGGCVDDLAGGRQCFSGLGSAGFLGGVERVLQLVAPATQPAEGSQASAELGSDRFFNGIMAAGGGWAQGPAGRARRRKPAGRRRKRG